MSNFRGARLWILLGLVALFLTACQSGEEDSLKNSGLEIVDASVGNLVWDDYHPNGILEPGEPGLAGVTVKLIDLGADNLCNTSDDSVLQEVITDANGHYRIDAEPGLYCLQFVLPAGDFVFSAKDQGNNEALDSDADPNTGYTDIIVFEEDIINNTVDAAMHPSKTCIGDFVWNDLDRDGIQDENEPGIEGVSVQLVDPGPDGRCGTPDDKVLETTSTDENGFYAFNGLDGGDYCVQFVRPDGFTPSPQGQGNDEAVDSNPDPATGITSVISVETGETEITIDAGYYKPNPNLGSIGDTVFIDSNGNGTQDAGEPGIPDVTLRLTTPGPDNICDTNDDTLLATRSTDANGKYLFGSLEEDTYCVDVVSATLPPGISRRLLTTNNDPEKVELAMGEDFLDADFGYKPPADKASLGDRVFNDLNQNGIQDPNEPGIDGLEVMLLDPGDNGICEDGDTVLENTSTNSSGIYSFDELTPSDYCVMFNLPDGFVFSPANQGTNDAADSDANPSNGKSPVVTLEAGDNNNTVDAGGYEPSVEGDASLGDRVFNDLDADGVQDPGEPGIAGLEVMLLDPGDDSCEDGDTVLDNTTTGAGGIYRFTDLVPGDYCVMFNAPDDFVFSPANQGGNDALDSDANPSNGKSQVVTLAEDEDNPTVDAGVYRPIAPICSLNLNVTADPISITPGPVPSCDTLEDKPDTITWRFDGGSNPLGQCAGSTLPNATNAKGKRHKDFECSGSVDPNQAITVTPDKGGSVTVSPGGEFTLDLKASKELRLSNAGGTQNLEIHTSCSQPIAAGLTAGGLTIVALDGRREPETDVTFTYEVTNDGTDVTDASISDSFGTVDDDFDLDAGASISFTRTQNITSTTTNTVNVTSILAANGQTCTATDSATVEVLPPPLSCRDGKPQRLVFEYTGEGCGASQNTQGGKFECSGSPGAGTVSISLEKDSDKMSLSPGSVSVGDSVTLTGRDGKLKSSAEINVGGQFLDIHTSCSAPLQVGDQFGSLILREFVPEN